MKKIMKEVIMKRIKLKALITSYYPAFGGLFVGMIFFSYGLANNLSMSYMGNTSERVTEFILANFLGAIITFLLKVLGVYIVIGAAAGTFIYFSVESLRKLFPFAVRKGFLFAINAAVSFVLFLSFFFKDIILYPQLYMNNFHNKNALFKAVVNFLTDSVHPGVFTGIQVFLFAAGVLLISTALFRTRHRVISVSLLSALCVVVLLTALHPFRDSGVAGNTSGERPNILIIASDALRPDHLSGHGYFRDTSPSIDRLIRNGVSFRNAFIEVPRTFPSWVSILTGQYSATHGIRHMFPTSRDLNRSFPSIAGTLKEKGYYTSVVTDYAGDIFSRVDLGFEKVDTPYFNFDYVLQSAILENHTFLLPFLSNRFGLMLFPVMKDSAYFCPPSLLKDRILREIRNSGERPFFISTFFSSTHFPYAPPYPYYSRYRAPGYSGPYKFYKQRIISLDNDAGGTRISAEDIAQVRALYDAGIRAMDDAVGEVIAFLRRNNLYDNTIIVVLSDHGENLYEDDLGMGHGEHFRGHYAVKIPLVFHCPKIIKKHREIHDVVRVVDIAPTILSLAGIGSSPTMEGVSLTPLLQGKQAPPQRAFGETGIWFDNILREDLFFQYKRILYPDITFLSEIDFHFGNQLVLSDDFRDVVNLSKHRYAFDGRYKLIYMPLSDRIEYELYDVHRDPHERDNIASRDPVNLARMKKILFQWVRRNGDVIVKDEYIFPILRY